MDTINTYLVAVARGLRLSDDELVRIRTSVSNLQTKLDNWFGDDLIKHFQFGSSTRDTILPRRVDGDSDIDYMVAFKNEDDYKPQTLLNQLREFVESKYTRSEIYQSHPTIVLELNHIKFELVPAVMPYVYNDSYHIPAPSSGFMDWMLTEPMKLKRMIDESNARYNGQIKRLIRLLKYWNVMNGKVYSSYQIEQYVGQLVFINCSMLEDYFFHAVKWLPEGGLPQYKKDKVQRLKGKVEEIRKDYYDNGYKYLAMRDLENLIPRV